MAQQCIVHVLSTISFRGTNIMVHKFMQPQVQPLDRVITTSLGQIFVEHGQVLHEVHSQAVVGMLCGVDLVPENVRIRVRANGVSVTASEGSQEGWPLVAGTGSACEAQLQSTSNVMSPLN